MKIIKFCGSCGKPLVQIEIIPNTPSCEGCGDFIKDTTPIVGLFRDDEIKHIKSMWPGVTVYDPL